jgi:hypothetical protein
VLRSLEALIVYITIVIVSLVRSITKLLSTYFENEAAPTLEPDHVQTHPVTSKCAAAFETATLEEICSRHGLAGRLLRAGLRSHSLCRYFPSARHLEHFEGRMTRSISGFAEGSRSQSKPNGEEARNFLLPIVHWHFLQETLESMF